MAETSLVAYAKLVGLNRDGEQLTRLVGPVAGMFEDLAILWVADVGDSEMALKFELDHE